ncbi:DUF2490 domain-containing protein [Tenacibaculum aquimarinum]|uniref:DUF2490 domain-containing protein n=1 Tax=Tenacibaculum aquimarinum TaxID=2910675 RepID=UPI001F0B038B|nr:DUF2490 domain-containing protein [Tenacibaculum aquimarinum]MCH3884504.1 DUF2490 domain-containing protein [Tenacibaculum aquimarinum]
MKNNIILLIMFAVLGTVKAQESANFSHFSSWNSFTPKVNLSEKFYAKSEFHIRRTDFLSVWEQLLIRPSIHYKPNTTFDLSVGYSFIRNYNYAEFSVPIDANEHNIWEQVALSHKEGKYDFNHRFRFEQRFIDNIIASNDSGFAINGTNYANRFRYRFTVSRPLFKISEDKKVSIKCFDEVFLSLDDGLEPIDLNQNWVYLGLSVPLRSNISFGLGYHHIGLTSSNEVFVSEEILATSISLSL